MLAPSIPSYLDAKPAIDSEMIIDRIPTPCRFASIIGQSPIVHALKESIAAHLNGGELVSPLLIAPAGTGKTAILSAYGHALKDTGKKVIICTATEFRKSTDALWSDICGMIDDAERGWALLIDEGQELFDAKVNTQQVSKIRALCMKALDGNFRGGDIPLSDELIARFNRKNCVIGLATNYPGKLPEALRTRAELMNLSLYNEAELIQILVQMLSKRELRGNEESLGIIARCGRGTARPMEQIARQLQRQNDASGEGKSTVNKADIMNALRSLQMFPQGMSPTEMRIMSRMIENPTSDASVLAGFPNLDVTTWRLSRAHMLSRGFLEEAKGRKYKTSAKGARFLETCKAEKFAW